MKDKIPEQQATDIDIPVGMHIDETGRILVPRVETRQDKRLRQHFEKLRGSKIDAFEIRGKAELED